jgi:hypothetical protein
MEKKQALNFLYNLAKGAELPKSLTGNEAINYLNKIEEAKEVLTSCITDKPTKKY